MTPGAGRALVPISVALEEFVCFGFGLVLLMALGCSLLAGDKTACTQPVRFSGAQHSHLPRCSCLYLLRQLHPDHLLCNPHHNKIKCRVSVRRSLVTVAIKRTVKWRAAEAAERFVRRYKTQTKQNCTKDKQELNFITFVL